MEEWNGQLALRIPLEQGGIHLVDLVTGIGEVIDGELVIVIQPWLAEKVNIHLGSSVIVDNLEGRFRMTRNDPD